MPEPLYLDHEHVAGGLLAPGLVRPRRGPRAGRRSRPFPGSRRLAFGSPSSRSPTASAMMSVRSRPCRFLSGRPMASITGSPAMLALLVDGDGDADDAREGELAAFRQRPIAGADHDVAILVEPAGRHAVDDLGRSRRQAHHAAVPRAHDLRHALRAREFRRARSGAAASP